MSKKIIQLNKEIIKTELKAVVRNSVGKMLACADLPFGHWTRIHTKNVTERLNCEIRRRTRVVGTFPDGTFALMLVFARWPKGMLL